MKRIVATLGVLVAVSAVSAPLARLAEAQGEYVASSTTVSDASLICDGRHAERVTIQTFADAEQTRAAPDVPVQVGWYLPDGTPAESSGVTNHRGTFTARFNPDTDGAPQQFMIVVIIGRSISRQMLTCEAPVPRLRVLGRR